MPRKLTASDVVEVTGYSRQELRLILEALPYYRDQKSFPRKAREFSRHDLIALGVVQALEVRYGMRKDAIATIFDLLRNALLGPKRQNSQAHLLISIDPPAVSYREAPTKGSEGILVPLESVFARVDHHLGSYPGSVREQRDVLSPALISGRRKSANP
ncbi:MAG TPA: hypothetical protein VJ323_13315 [Bryobacteraceae bacterium]|jgi:hypothetical protein|nr:hypothetical protein [Bryobacteraceae bacterium]